MSVLLEAGRNAHCIPEAAVLVHSCGGGRDVDVGAVLKTLYFSAL